jgi:MFS family permease
MSNRKYYYWVIAAIAFLEMGMYGGAVNNINGLFKNSITGALDISRSTYALALSARSLVAILSSLIMGAFLRRFGYRRAVAISLVLAAGGFALLGFSQNVTMLVVGAILVGMAEGVCAAGGVSRLIGSWFHKHHGLVLGIITAATGLGGSLLTIVLTFLMGAYNWRVAHIFTSCCMLLVGILMILLIRDTPQEMGMKPYGEGHDIRHLKRVHDDHWHGYNFAQLKKKFSFYAFLVLTFLSSLCLYIIFPSVESHFQDIGMSEQDAGQIKSVMLLLLSVGKLLFGFFSDKFGAKAVSMACLFLMVLSMVLFSIVNSVVVGYITVSVYALALPLVGVTIPLLLPALFGYGSGASGIGIALAMVPAANMLGGILADVLCEAFHGYRPIFIACIFAAIAIVIGYTVLFIRTGADRKKIEVREKTA